MTESSLIYPNQQECWVSDVPKHSNPKDPKWTDNIKAESGLVDCPTLSVLNLFNTLSFWNPCLLSWSCFLYSTWTITAKRTHDDSIRPLLGNMSIDHHVLHPEHSYLPVNDEVLLDTSDTETVWWWRCWRSPRVRWRRSILPQMLQRRCSDAHPTPWDGIGMISPGRP